VQSVALPPLQVRHDASHGAHPVSLVVVQTALWYCPAGQTVQVSHEMLPVMSAYVPGAQLRQEVLALEGW
jgi:hypothetical protein